MELPLLRRRQLQLLHHETKPQQPQRSLERQGLLQLKLAAPVHLLRREDFGQGGVGDRPAAVRSGLPLAEGFQLGFGQLQFLDDGRTEQGRISMREFRFAELDCSSACRARPASCIAGRR